MAATRRLSELVSASLPLLDLPPGRLVVALSGGADSACLAFLCRESGLSVSAVHIDHQLPASPLMTDAATRVAAVLEIDMETIRVVLDDGPSLEERARNARYAALETIEASVVTGHTRDDSAETMLINLIRGTGGGGLRGIPRHRPPNIYRPLIEMTRDVTREIAALAGLPFVDDPMNDEMALTRNRVRAEILPRMREINPQVEAALARAAAFVDADNELLDGIAGGTGPVVAASVVSTLPRPIADRLVRGFLEANAIGPTANRIARVWSVAIGESDRQDLTGGRSVLRRGAMLVVE